MKRWQAPIIFICIYAFYWLFIAPKLLPAKNVSILFVSLFIFFLLMISFFIKTRWRILHRISIIITAATLLFFALQPVYVKSQIPHREKMLDHYLSTAYPGEVYTIEHENDERRPYNFSVSFQNEPNVVYSLRVTNQSVYRTSYSILDDNQKPTLLHEKPGDEK